MEMKKQATKILSLIIALICALGLCSCVETPSSNTSTSTAESSTADTEDLGIWASALYTSDTTLGEGEKTLTVKVEADGRSVSFTIKTNADNLGDALVGCGLVEGEAGQYGLYVKKVNGITADYDTDKHYWGISKGGVDLMTGADGESIVGGESYELVRKK